MPIVAVPMNFIQAQLMLHDLSSICLISGNVEVKKRACEIAGHLLTSVDVWYRRQLMDYAAGRGFEAFCIQNNMVGVRWSQIQ